MPQPPEEPPPEDAPRGLARWLPFLQWLPEARRPGNLRADLLAGLTGAIVVLPQGVAFATLAGMPPEYGLYSAMVPCIIAALFGSSRQMVTGPANAISLTVLALVAPLAVVGSAEYVSLVITLSLMVGCWQLLVGLTGLGRLVSRIPHSVILGFTTGAAILIVNSQVKHLFGFDWERGLSVFDSVARLVAEFRDAPGGFAPLAALRGGLLVNEIVAVATIIACVAARRWVTAVVPYMLVGVVVGSLVAWGLAQAMGSAWALPAIDELPGALPPLSLPDLRLEVLWALLVPSLVMTLLALAEAMSIASAVAIRNGRRINGTQEILAQGLANVGGSFFSSYPASGSFNRSGVNVEAGARTPLAAISAGLILIGLLGFVGPLFAYLPMAAVAGILVMVAWTLMDFGYLKRALHGRPADSVGWLLTFMLTITVSLELAIVAGLLAFWVVNKLFGNGEDGTDHAA